MVYIDKRVINIVENALQSQIDAELFIKLKLSGTFSKIALDITNLPAPFVSGPTPFVGETYWNDP